jgi:hypothetical protein
MLLNSFSHKLAQPSSYMFLPSKTGGDGNQQVSNLEKSVSGAAATTLLSYSLKFLTFDAFGQWSDHERSKMW